MLNRVQHDYVDTLSIIPLHNSLPVAEGSGNTVIQLNIDLHWRKLQFADLIGNDFFNYVFSKVK